MIFRGTLWPPFTAVLPESCASITSRFQFFLSFLEQISVRNFHWLCVSNFLFVDCGLLEISYMQFYIFQITYLSLFRLFERFFVVAISFISVCHASNYLNVIWS